MCVSIYIHTVNIYIYTYTHAHTHRVKPRLLNIIHYKIMFNYWFVLKLQQCCLGRLCQLFVCVWFASTVICACSIFISTIHVFELWKFVWSLKYFLLKCLAEFWIVQFESHSITEVPFCVCVCVYIYIYIYIYTYTHTHSLTFYLCVLIKLYQ